MEVCSGRIFHFNATRHPIAAQCNSIAHMKADRTRDISGDFFWAAGGRPDIPRYLPVSNTALRPPGWCPLFGSERSFRGRLPSELGHLCRVLTRPKFESCDGPRIGG